MIKLKEKYKDEFIYCIVHAAEHMKLGGVGIRVILDFAVYKTLNMDWEYYSELDKLDLRVFYDKLSTIAEKWFLNPQPFSVDKPVAVGDGILDIPLTSPDSALEDFILESGLYGTEENNNAARVGGSKVKFITSSLFPSYESMCSVYPWLGGNKALLPIAWAERGTKALLHRRENIKSEFSRARKANKAPEELNQLFKELEI